MPVNRNALIRFRTIDKCLQNRFRKWTLEDLIDACSEALYEYEGIDKGVSKRTVQGDIQMMRSDKLGYNAPIVVWEKKYYTYEEPDYSITNIPLTEQDLDKLTEVVEILRQFKGFSHFRELDGMVQKLEDHVHTQKTKQRPIIDFEKNENLKGLQYLDVLYQAVLHKKVLRVSYQSFKAKLPQEFLFHAYLLKEFNNRWFLLGAQGEQQKVMTLALDRIVSIEQNEAARYRENEDFDPSTYYENTIGVTVKEGSPIQKVEILIDKYNAPYVITKPLHHTQKVLETTKEGVIIQIEVIINFELERLILGFGEGMKVLKPNHLRKRMIKKFEQGLEKYN